MGGGIITVITAAIMTLLFISELGKLVGGEKEERQQGRLWPSGLRRVAVQAAELGGEAALFFSMLGEGGGRDRMLKAPTGSLSLLTQQFRCPPLCDTVGDHGLFLLVYCPWASAHMRACLTSTPLSTDLHLRRKKPMHSLLILSLVLTLGTPPQGMDLSTST